MDYRHTIGYLLVIHTYVPLTLLQLNYHWLCYHKHVFSQCDIRIDYFSPEHQSRGTKIAAEEHLILEQTYVYQWRIITTSVSYMGHNVNKTCIYGGHLLHAYNLRTIEIKIVLSYRVYAKLQQMDAGASLARP